jgi:hypothetical protein
MGGKEGTQKSVAARSRRVARDFRIVQAGFALLFLGLAWWLFISELGTWWRIVAGILGMAGLFALIDVLSGPPRRARKVGRYESKPSD